MSFLPLTAQQLALLAAFDTALDQAFEFGVGSAPEVDPVTDYAKFRAFRAEGELEATDYTPSIKQMFKAAFAAMLVEALAPSTWTDITLAAPWVGSLQYYVDIFGQVHLRGQVSGGIQGELIATVPQPTAIAYLPIAATIASTTVAAYVFLQLDGGLYSSPTPAGTYTMLSLDGIVYPGT